MDYSLLAGQLLSVQANLLQVPAYQQLSKMVPGRAVRSELSRHPRDGDPSQGTQQKDGRQHRPHHLSSASHGGKGLIARSSDLSDNRQIFVRLTENGVNAIQKARAEVISRVSSLLEALGPEDAREYIRIQEKILDNFLGNS